MFMNAGNYGLPLVEFAFGADALVYASLMFVGMKPVNEFSRCCGCIAGHFQFKKIFTKLIQNTSDLFSLSGNIILKYGVAIAKVNWSYGGNSGQRCNSMHAGVYGNAIS